MDDKIPAHIKALVYLYQKSITGEGATNHAYGKEPQGNHYFRNHFNRRGEFEDLRVTTVWDKYLDKSFKRYFIHPDDYAKVEDILRKYDLL